MMWNAAKCQSVRRLGILAFSLTVLSFTACQNHSGTPYSDAKSSVESPQIDGDLDFLSPEEEVLASITIELAETPRDWAKGLMYRKEMPLSHGMLFVFELPEPKRFWMRNTYIPLDIIFLDEDDTIVGISENAAPLSDTNYRSPGPVKYVLEVNGGFSRQHRIKRGVRIRWKRR